MRYFPVFLDLEGRTVLVAGGGAAAANKLRLFAKTNARLRCIAPAVIPEIAALAAGGRVTLDVADPEHAAFGDAYLIIAATETDADCTIAQRARALGLLVNAVDKTALCTFITPSIVDRGQVVVAIGTGGAAPVLARRTRESIETLLPERLGDLAALIGENRELVSTVLHDTPSRRAFWEAAVDGTIGRLALAGQKRQAGEEIRRALDDITGAGAPVARAVTVIVSPVFAGDLTLRALRALQDAETLVCGTEVPVAVLDRARRDATRIFVADTVFLEAVRDAVAGRTAVLLNPQTPASDVHRLVEMLHVCRETVETCAKAVPIR